MSQVLRASVVALALAGLAPAAGASTLNAIYSSYWVFGDSLNESAGAVSTRNVAGGGLAATNSGPRSGAGASGGSAQALAAAGTITDQVTTVNSEPVERGARGNAKRGLGIRSLNALWLGNVASGSGGGSSSGGSGGNGGSSDPVADVVVDTTVASSVRDSLGNTFNRDDITDQVMGGGNTGGGTPITGGGDSTAGGGTSIGDGTGGNTGSGGGNQNAGGGSGNTPKPPVVTPPIAPVPLPAAGILLVAGLGGLTLLGRKRRA
ncbi:MAG: VPLPA-CTERM sorting domain-containing protein [Mangrovicoccus sp.]|nr:VPLPA-CTERM sorting domain-containing protein [Mangrovicoccus sp.]